jgi:hypothetical protein
MRKLDLFLAKRFAQGFGHRLRIDKCTHVFDPLLEANERRSGLALLTRSPVSKRIVRGDDAFTIPRREQAAGCIGRGHTTAHIVAASIAGRVFGICRSLNDARST